MRASLSRCSGVSPTSSWRHGRKSCEWSSNAADVSENTTGGSNQVLCFGIVELQGRSHCITPKARMWHSRRVRLMRDSWKLPVQWDEYVLLKAARFDTNH